MNNSRSFPAVGAGLKNLGNMRDYIMNYSQSFPAVGAGLKNLGNACFANAALQSLLHNLPIRYCLSCHEEQGKICNIKLYQLFCII